MRIYKQKHPNGTHYKKWTIDYRDHLGTARKMQGYTDESATRTLADRLEKLVAYRTARRAPDADLAAWLEELPGKTLERFAEIGLIDSETSAVGKPLMIARKVKRLRASNETYEVTGGHLADYRKHLQAKECSKQHLGDTTRYCVQLIERMKMTHLSDLTGQKIEAYAVELREAGKSARTVNKTLASISGFCRWLVREGRLSENPAGKVGKLNEKADRRRVRRALTVEEIRRLVDAAEKGKAWQGMTGPERALLYRLALGTGLRLGEIRSLVRSDFDLDGQTPSVTIRAENEKAGRGDTLPLRPDLAADLGAYFGAALALPMSRAFPTMPEKGSDMIRADLEAAGIDREDDRGRVVDFHALRHTFGTLLARSGVHPKTAMDLMRHSTVDLTMNLYTHTVLGDRAKATASLPDFCNPSREAKTGTADIDEGLNGQDALQGVSSTLHFPKTKGDCRKDPEKQAGKQGGKQGVSGREMAGVGICTTEKDDNYSKAIYQ